MKFKEIVTSIKNDNWEKVWQNMENHFKWLEDIIDNIKRESREMLERRFEK